MHFAIQNHYVIASDFPQHKRAGHSQSSYQLRPLLTTDNFQPKVDLGDPVFMYHWSLEASDSGLSATDPSSSLTWWSGGLSASFLQCGWLWLGVNTAWTSLVVVDWDHGE